MTTADMLRAAGMMAVLGCFGCVTSAGVGAMDSGVSADAGVAADVFHPYDAAAPNTGTTDTSTPDAASPDTTALDAGAPDAGDTAAPTCPAGVVCVDSFPFSHTWTTVGGSQQLDSYACKPSADESGPERLYRVTVPASGFLSAVVVDGAGVDVDVHILTTPTEKACLDRGHHHARADVTAGTWWISVDSFTSKGKALAGDYTLRVGFIEPSKGPCGMQSGVMKRVKDQGKHLPMPAKGPIVMEAHLVTQQEPPPFPATSTDKLAAHYQLSESQTKLVMHRSQKWAPLEGGNFYGAGIGHPKFVPVVDEGWYVNMYWTKASRPARGTPMILRLPGTNRAVVVSAGHETGPGKLAHIGGTPEETHFYLGTKHLSEMWIGIAKDSALPFGPRICTDAEPASAK